MKTKNEAHHARAAFQESATIELNESKKPASVLGIIDHKLMLLAVAGAAVTADCDPCLDLVVPELEQAGVSKDDIRGKVEEGRFLGAYPELGEKVLQNTCACVHGK